MARSIHLIPHLSADENLVFGTAGPPDPVERSHWQFLWLLARVPATCQRYEEKRGAVPRWVEHQMGERLSRAEQLEHRVQSASVHLLTNMPDAL